MKIHRIVIGLENIGRVVYRAGSNYRLKHDDRLLSDLESVVGAGNVRLLGRRGVTARIEIEPRAAALAVDDDDAPPPPVDDDD